MLGADAIQDDCAGIYRAARRGEREVGGGVPLSVAVKRLGGAARLIGTDRQRGHAALVRDLLACLPVAENIPVECGALGIIFDHAVSLVALLFGKVVGTEDLIDRHFGEGRDLGQLIVGRPVMAEEIE